MRSQAPAQPGPCSHDDARMTAARV
jgi:hypothetical protein